MSFQLVLIADDLSGALDTGVPFVAHGLGVAVAIGPDGVERAMAAGGDVLVVNSATRALPGAEAERAMAEIARLVRQRPRFIFKKIDSRLKGNAATETAALAEAFGITRAIIAPAVPDQGRFTEKGCVVGTGVDVPMPIAPLFAASGLEIEIRDAGSDADLDAVAADLEAATLAVGARGLGAALARRLGGPARRRAPPVRPDGRVLLAIGSRDPITAQQIARLAARHPELALVDAPDGEIPAGTVGLPLVLRCVGDIAAHPAAEVARRFATGVARVVGATSPGVLLMSGGDTASAVLSALGVRDVELAGEWAPGVPLLRIGAAGHKGPACLVKSGGFGGPDVLEGLLAPAATAD